MLFTGLPSAPFVGVIRADEDQVSCARRADSAYYFSCTVAVYTVSSQCVAVFLEPHVFTHWDQCSCSHCVCNHLIDHGELVLVV